MGIVDGPFERLTGFVICNVCRRNNVKEGDVGSVVCSSVTVPLMLMMVTRDNESKSLVILIQKQLCQVVTWICCVRNNETSTIRVAFVFDNRG